MSRVFAVGSINVDLVCRAPRQPRPGETLFGTEFATHPGGKGANQAVAAARSGAETWMVGRVGADGFGREQRAYLDAQGVRVDLVRESEGIATGVGLIVVSDDGENSIVVVSGANAEVAEPDLPPDGFRASDVVCCPFEIPLETIAAALARAREAGARTVLNPAPAREADRALLALADVLIVNETELAFFASTPELDASDVDAVFAGIDRLRIDDGQWVVATLGAAGLVARGPTGDVVCAGHRVDAVDTTGAGDTFVGALAARLARGESFDGALAFANRAASICVERPGAGPSIPTEDEVRARASAEPA